jgi:hypothetical protein
LSLKPDPRTARKRQWIAEALRYIVQETEFVLVFDTRIETGECLKFARSGCLGRRVTAVLAES